MVSRTSYEIGAEFERDFTKYIGGKKVPASGALWFAKLDSEAGNFLFSLKATDSASIRVTQDMIREMVEHATGPGSKGVIPGLALRIGEPQYDLIALRPNDLLTITSEQIKLGYESKYDAKLREARVPSILREAE